MRILLAVRRAVIVAMTRVALFALALDACGGGAPPAAATADTPHAAMQTAPVAGDGPEFHSASQLARVADDLAKGSSTARTVGAHAAYSYVQARRVSSGVPEVHDRWIDVVMVQSGHAALVTGGRADGSHVASPGEHRGGAIAGGTTRPIGPGDLVVIPAGIAHQYQLAPGDSVRYLTIKVLQPARAENGRRVEP